MTKAKTKAQFRHPGSRSVSHQRDKEQGEARRETAWLGVDAPTRPSPRRSFPGLEGHEYRHDGQHWQRCPGAEEFADYLEEEGKRRAWYMSRTTRKGAVIDMRRPVDSPLVFLTTTLAPWESDWLAAEIVAGRDPRPKLALIRNQWLTAAQQALKGQRHLLGYAFHCDTDDPHFDLILSRQDGEGGRIGKPGLLLTGPWTVGVDRQVRSGAIIHAEKRNQLRRAVGNFRHRYGQDAVPLDITLARALDTAADDVLGDELRPFREAYARRVPELERKHAVAQLEVVEAAKERLLQRTVPMPEPAPAPIPVPRPTPAPEPEIDFPSLR